MHHYGDNVIGSIYMRFSGNETTLTPAAGEKNIPGKISAEYGRFAS